ncbi:MAG: hypothetical protein ACJ76Y_15950 [Thermoanaerobaculia bacterium]
MLNKTGLTIAVAWITLVVSLATGQAWGQVSSRLEKEEPRSQYTLFKNTFERMFAQGVIKLEFIIDEGKVDLIDCTSGSDYLNLGKRKASARTLRLADVAYEIVHWRVLLSSLHYPSKVWQPLLEEYEQERLRGALQTRGPEAVERFARKLQGTLNRYRAASAPQLTPVMAEGGCGAGEVGVRIATVPGNGRALFIPVFFYELCKTQRIDPDDPAHCDRWREPADGMLFWVAGDYFYRATWPGGAQRRGRLSFTHLEDGQTVTLRVSVYRSEAVIRSW